MNTIKCSVYIATSLDGYIAREDGDIDWLNAANSTVTEGEDCGYHAFMRNIDILVMGRKTYETVRTFEEWPYGDQEVIVLSSQYLNIPGHLSKTVSHSSETPLELCERLGKTGKHNLYIDGGITIQHFLKAGLITDITITTIPIIIGRGTPLFSQLDLGQDIALKLVESKSYDFGFVQSKYEVLNTM